MTDEIKVPEDRMLAFTLGYEVGKTDTYCEQVMAGAKLCASFPVHKENLTVIREEIASRNLQAVVVEDHSKDFSWIEIYKYLFVEQLLKALSERGAPRTAFDHWVNGKLFGYSDLEIFHCLEEHGLVDDGTM